MKIRIKSNVSIFFCFSCIGGSSARDTKVNCLERNSKMALLGVETQKNNQIVSSLEVDNKRIVDLSEEKRLQELYEIVDIVRKKNELSSVTERLFRCRDSPTHRSWLFQKFTWIMS